MKRVLVFTVLFLCILSTMVNANTIYSIDMDIFIDKNGNAQVTEEWDCNVTQGTESYHPYYNLESSEIRNLKVSDEDNNTYETLNSWNVNSSFNGKSYKCGLNKIRNGVEICWGISEYGKKNYKVEYEITNFVSKLNDSQMVYWTLIPYDFSTSIGNADITIRSDFKYKDTLDVWGYGNYGGFCYVADGVIKMSSDGKLDSSEYMTILVKFPEDTFDCANSINRNFDYYFNMSEEGAVHYEDTSTSPKDFNQNSFLLDFISNILTFALFLIVLIGIIVSAMTASNWKEKIYEEDKQKVKNAEYFRDIPCDKDIFKAFYIATVYKLNANKTDLLGAIILKWLREKKIAIEKRERGIFKKEETCIVLNSNMNESSLGFFNEYEKELYKMMLSASGDGVLEKKEFEKWCSKEYQKILGWFEKILNSERDKLIASGYIEVIEENKFFKVKKYKLNNDLLNEAINLSGLKKFLKDYSLIHEREAIEVALFEDYLVYAQMLGIAKQVMEEFKELYPDIIEKSEFNSFDDINFVMLCATSGISKANSARSAAESYSSGGGGFSSGGGGGGSFGGGGGRRRFPLILNELKKSNC